MRVVLDFTHMGEDCPYCHKDYMCVLDDGQQESYQVVCFCGAKARVNKTDPDLVALLEGVTDASTQ